MHAAADVVIDVILKAARRTLPDRKSQRGELKYCVAVL
jgi:hypothetical protein